MSLKFILEIAVGVAIVLAVYGVFSAIFDYFAASYSERKFPKNKHLLR
jgi:hypothetical protein